MVKTSVPVREGLRLSRSKAVPGAELYRGDDLKTFGTGWHFHEGWQLVAVTKGQRHYQLRSGTVTAKPGQLLLLPPRLVHKAHCDRNQQTSFRIATLPEKCVALETAHTAISHAEPQLVDAFVSVFRMLVKTQEIGKKSSIFTHLHDIFDARILAGNAGSCMFPPSVRQIEAYMLTHLQEVPSLSQLSSLVGLDKYYFAHMFSKHVGLSPLAFHTRARLMQARSLIAQGWTLSDTSAYLSFSDQSHFGRHFKRVYDMTPSEYQRSVASE